jgi:hypothetical protein
MSVAEDCELRRLRLDRGRCQLHLQGAVMKRST